MTPRLVYTKLRPDAVEPFQSYPGDAGWDLTTIGQIPLEPGEWADLPTGLAIEVPEDHYGRVTGRSSTFRQRGLLVIEGVADSGFRGEWKVCVYNATNRRMVIQDGARLAQLIISPYAVCDLVESRDLSPSERGERGYGSSGS